MAQPSDTAILKLRSAKQDRQEDALKMSCVSLAINREELAIMGVVLPGEESFKCAAEGISSNMFEGVQSTRREIEIIRDYVLANCRSRS
jgi:hypothetical protein